MRKSIIILALFACNALMAQSYLPILDYEFTELEDGVLVETAKPYSYWMELLKDSIYEWDTLYISLDKNHFGVSVIGPYYNFTQSHFTWLTQKFGYILLVNEHEYFIGIHFNESPDLLFIFKENYTISETDTLEFLSSDAIYEISVNPVDVNGTPFSQLSGSNKYDMGIMAPQGQGYSPSFLVGYLPEYYNIYLSELSSNIKIQFSSINFDIEINNSASVIEFPVLDGINENHLMVNQPEDFIKTNIQMYITNEEVDKTLVGFIRWIYWKGFKGGYWYWGVGQGSSFIINNTNFWNGELYLIGNESEDFDNSLCLVAKTENEDIPYTSCSSGFLEINNDSICTSDYFELPYNIYKAGNNDTLFFGDSPSTLSFNWFNNLPDANFINTIGSNYCMLSEVVSPIDGLLYQVKDDNGTVVYEDILQESMQFNTGESGNYSVEITNLACPIQVYSGTSKLITSFNLGTEDASPPVINPVQFRNNQNKPAYKIDTNDDLSLLFSATDYYIITDSIYGGELLEYQPIFNDSTRVFVKEYSSEIWQEVNVEKYHEDSISGYYYKSDLSGYTNLDSSALDLKVSIADYAGNTTEVIINPAVLIDGFTITGETANFLLPEINLNIYPNPTTSYINVQISSEYKSDMILSIYDVKGKLVLQNNLELIDGSNTFQIDLSKDQTGNKIEPGVYFCIFKIDDKTIARKIIVE